MSLLAEIGKKLFSLSEPLAVAESKAAIRTAIATSFTVAYLMLLALGLDPGLGLNLNNGILANFHLVYIFTIGTYFITASLERIVDLAKGKSSLFG